MEKSDPPKQDSEGKVIEINRGERAASEPADSSADPRPSDETGSVADERARLKSEREELMQTLVRRQADFENYRKRIERERPEDHRRGVASVVEDLLPVLDAFERALKAHDDPAYEEYRKGLELIYRQLWEKLARHGVERIAAAGKQFDPHYHQAIERVETDEIEDGKIVEVLQDGFVFHGRVLRPSIVRVAVHSDGSGGGRPSAARHRAN
jgi:molecular chaperone GrpE